MHEETYQRLRHWWDAFQQSLSSKDEETSRRRLYLLQAEIRKTLRESVPARARFKLNPLLSFGVTVTSVLVLIVLLASPLVRGPSGTGTAIPLHQLKLTQPLTPSKATRSLLGASLLSLEDSGATKTAIKRGKRQEQNRAAREMTPPPTPSEVLPAARTPLGSPNVQDPAPASGRAAPGEPPVPAESRAQLDPLALLLTLEGELEK
ncbi:MAG: hypothetical protein B1H03_04350 [Planctomycetales bacterium 4484_113]|nr:MAG: hypothetical protein B1H03_04350 [Planctomycetales bacterium 4484_113]